tara:strand:- start:803 stop:1606 length:804 start_codon:yes stop_codon:yes gene_type:complete
MPTHRAKMKYQLFSERCSGSNFIEAAIETNFPRLAVTQEFGFKHWLDNSFLNQRALPTELLFVIVIRNPFDWLRSIHAQPWHCAHQLRQLSFSDFIRSEWECIWDEQAHVKRDDPRWMKEIMFERNPLNGAERFRNILEVRKVKYTIWQNQLISHPRTIKISYEKFKDSPEQFLELISHAYDLKKPEEIVIPSGYKGSPSWKRRIAFVLTFGRVGRYIPRPRHPIALEDIDYILNNLDSKLESDWGYDIQTIAQSERMFTLNALGVQ